jgi:hypothetical protein
MKNRMLHCRGSIVELLLEALLNLVHNSTFEDSDKYLSLHNALLKSFAQAVTLGYNPDA